MNIYQALVINKDSYERTTAELEGMNHEYNSLLRGMIEGAKEAIETAKVFLTIGDVCETR